MIEIENEDFRDYFLPPSWLNEKYICTLLQNSESDNSIMIEKLKIKPAVAKGDHYASCMYRIRVIYKGEANTSKLTSLICKTNNFDEYTNGVLLEYHIYDQEIKMYKKILPAFKKIINIDLSPNALQINLNENSILFNDLNEVGFQMAPRLYGLDRTHAQLVLIKLATMHAISVVYNRDHAGELEHFFNRGMFNRQSGGINSYFESNMQYLVKAVSSWPGWQRIAGKLARMAPNVVENARKVFDPIDGDFNVLTHGDLWVNNVMYKYNAEGTPVDCLMVDFQMCKWGTPAIDLLYFMATSLADDLRANHQDEFVLFYHSCLVEAFQQLNYTGYVPTLHALQQQFLKNYFYSFSSTVLVLPIMMSEHTVGADFKTLMGYGERSAEMKTGIYECEKFRAILKRVLPQYEQKGILDM